MPVPSSCNDLTESIADRGHYGWVFYQKKFSVPSFAKGQRVALRCDAVTHHARIYLNGELLATHECGFLPFEVELTEKLQPGEKLRRLCDEPESPARAGQQEGNLHP